MKTISISTSDYSVKHPAEQDAPLLDRNAIAAPEGRHVLGERHTDGFRSMMRRPLVAC